MAKEGKIFVYVSCYNCGCVVMNGWTFDPKEDNQNVWQGVCPSCRFPYKVSFDVK